MNFDDSDERLGRIEHQLEFLAVTAQSHDSQLAEAARLLAECARLNTENSSRIAKNSAQIEANSAQIAENSAQIAEHSAQIAEHSRQIGQLGDFVLRIGRIAEAQGGSMDKAFARIAEAQARTDERLNVLINIAERYFSNGRN